MYLSVDSGIAHSANRERDEVIELGRRISILVGSEGLVGSTLYLTYENLFRKYWKAIDQCPGVYHSDRSSLRNSAQKVLEVIGIFKILKKIG